jgi:hypothetical protein
MRLAQPTEGAGCRATPGRAASRREAMPHLADAGADTQAGLLQAQTRVRLHDSRGGFDQLGQLRCYE